MQPRQGYTGTKERQPPLSLFLIAFCDEYRMSGTAWSPHPFSRDIFGVISKFLQTTDALHLALTCNELAQWTLDVGSDFWKRALDQYDSEKLVFPSSKSPRDQFYHLVHSLHSWITKPIVHKTKREFPHGYVDFIPVGEEIMMACHTFIAGNQNPSRPNLSFIT